MLYKKMFSVVLVSLLLNACSGSGGDEGTTTTYPWNSFSIASASDLPTCSGDIVGRLYYIESTNSFQVCKSTGWSVINVKGDNGTNGSDGLTISGMKRCSKIASSLLFEYIAVTYSTGDKFVSCSISTPNNSLFSSTLYMSTQSGVTSEGCYVGHDLDTASGGYWFFSLSGTTRTVVYNDVGSTSNGSGITFLNSDCTTSP